MEKKPKFTVLYEKLRGKSFEIDREVMSIGRKDSADIQLADGSVSSHHADIIRTEKDGEVCYLLRDNDSTNGTKINNEPITEQILKNSDLISFGHVEVLFDGADGKNNDTHVTHTIDLGSATTNTTTTQTLTNFSARIMDERKKNARTTMLMNAIIIAGGVLVVGVVIYTLFFH
ncbi:MAG: FHA domain-containing protein [Lentisphaerae bacterium]|nr:FHA domain-containing protein [Lentisphaerota bacterium]